MKTNNGKPDPNRPVRVLIVEAMIATPVGEAAARHCEIGERVTLPLSDVKQINAGMGQPRALYLDRRDDPTDGRHTLTDADEERVAATLRLREQARQRAGK